MINTVIVYFSYRFLVILLISVLPEKKSKMIIKFSNKSKPNINLNTLKKIR